jgi:hypothetical protein
VVVEIPAGMKGEVQLEHEAWMRDGKKLEGQAGTILLDDGSLMVELKGAGRVEFTRK